jgi:hypothetical protein
VFSAFTPLAAVTFKIYVHLFGYISFLCSFRAHCMMSVFAYSLHVVYQQVQHIVTLYFMFHMILTINTDFISRTH